jgi:hypothetical protein
MENGPKPSCKSQYLAIHDETQILLKQGYTIKAVYDYFLKKGVIHMSYNSPFAHFKSEKVNFAWRACNN